jgi:zinc D-Ala-D-Ala carboxypeptidase
MNPSDKITNNLTYEEVIHSDTAIRKGIANEPNYEQLENIVRLSVEIFQPLRNHFKVSIFINSFFRSLTLNKRIGGSKTSQHCANNGAAMDIRGSNGVTNKMLFDWMRDNLEFDQLIWEFGTDNEPRWVHVSLKESGNRKQVLKLTKVSGKTKTIVL